MDLVDLRGAGTLRWSARRLVVIVVRGADIIHEGVMGDASGMM